MKRKSCDLNILLLSITLVAAPVMSARAGFTNITILSEGYHVEGDLSGYGGYDKTASTPVQDGFEVEGNYVRGEASSSWVYASADTMCSTYPDGPSVVGTATAWTSITFRPQGYSLTIAVSGAEHEPPFGALASARLTDLDSGTTLLYEDSPAFGYFFFYGQLPVDPTHAYEFWMHAAATAFDGDHKGASVDLELLSSSSVIPAPGALILSGIGVGFVSWLRRRRTL